MYTYKTIFDFKQVGLNLICQVMWILRDHAIQFSERIVLGSQCPSGFCLLLFFVGIEKTV